MYENAKKQAEKILSQFPIESAPIDIENITEKLGIEIGYAPSTKYSGMLIRKTDGKVLMGINNNESAERMRFTIAHELGHFVLYPKDAVNIDYRSKEHISSKPKKEQLADFFAANLLMPEKFVRKDFEKAIKNRIFFEQDLIELANKYHVSQEAIKYRLIYLNLIPSK